MRLTGKRYDTGETTTIRVEGGVIADISSGLDSEALGGADVWLAPGFIDLQVNGYAGFDFNIGAWGTAEEISHDPQEVVRRLALSGTPLLCPAITTNSRKNTLDALAFLSRLTENSPDFAAAIPGIHLEGPYISPEDGPRGAHPLEHIRPPDWDEFQAFQEAAGGLIRICTLAPELPEALPFIRKLVRSGVRVAIGHTAAEPEMIRAAVDEGATISTHLGNGAHAVLKRHPNYLWEQLANDNLFATLILDGNHLPDSVIKVFCRTKGAERTILVSDAVSLGGLPPDRYAEGRFEVLESGKVTTAGTPYLAGSGHLLDVCIANALRVSGFSLAEVVRCVTENPAKILGLEHRKGSLKLGYAADLTLFRLASDLSLEIVATIRAGNAL